MRNMHPIGFINPIRIAVLTGVSDYPEWSYARCKRDRLVLRAKRRTLWLIRVPVSIVVMAAVVCGCAFVTAEYASNLFPVMLIVCFWTSTRMLQLAFIILIDYCDIDNIIFKHKGKKYGSYF